jgi:hypothetical protein
MGAARLIAHLEVASLPHAGLLKRWLCLQMRACKLLLSYLVETIECATGPRYCGLSSCKGG